jgi:hypothetical protein
MTILNVWCEPARALLAVDTRSTEAGSTRMPGREVSKLIPIVHLNVALAARGNAGFFAMFGCMLLTHSVLGDFDALVRAAPNVMQETFHWFVKSGGDALGAHAQASIDNQYAVLVGWSPGAQRMCAFELRWDLATRTYVSSEFDGGYKSPWSEAIERAYPRPDTIPAMQQLARAQLQLYEEKAPEWSTGGRLIVAQIDRLNMGIQSVCDLDARIRGR